MTLEFGRCRRAAHKIFDGVRRWPTSDGRGLVSQSIDTVFGAGGRGRYQAIVVDEHGRRRVVSSHRTRKAAMRALARALRRRDRNSRRGGS